MNTQLTPELQTTANIDKIKHIWNSIKRREIREIALDKIDEAQELNFDDDLLGEH